MAKKQQNNQFQTHIAEPRWQQVLSVFIVLLGVVFWVVAAIV